MFHATAVHAGRTPLDLGSTQCNALNLHRNALRQLLHCHTAPRRLVREELLVARIHVIEVRHVVQEDRRL